MSLSSARNYALRASKSQDQKEAVELLSKAILELASSIEATDAKIKKINKSSCTAKRRDAHASARVHLQAFLLDDGAELRGLRLDEVGDTAAACRNRCGRRSWPWFSLMSSRSRNTLISLLSASRTGAGALFGRKMPNQDETSNFASSGALSRMVGMLGASAARSGVVTASALSLPS